MAGYTRQAASERRGTPRLYRAEWGGEMRHGASVYAGWGVETLHVTSPEQVAIVEPWCAHVRTCRFVETGHAPSRI